MILTVLVNICLQKNLQLTTEILSYVCFFIVVNNYIPVLAYVILLIAGSPCKMECAYSCHTEILYRYV